MARKARSLDDLSDVFLTCRTTGHACEPTVTYLERHGRRDVHRTLWVCKREQDAGVPDPFSKEMLSAARGPMAGKLIEVPRPTYPDGYLVEEKLGQGKQRPKARLALSERMLQAPKKRRLRAVG